MAKLILINVLTNTTSKAEWHEIFADFEIEFWSGVQEIRAAFSRGPADCVLVAGSVPDRSGYLDALQHYDRKIPVVFWDPDMSAAEAAQLARAGAFDCLGYRNGVEQVRDSVDRAVEFGRHRAIEGADPWRKLLVGNSHAMKIVAETIRLVAPRRCTILITGESGTGKEVAARAIHQASPRSQQPFVAVNCAALPENLLEAELFGHSKGAFTGAASARVGRFEQAHRGTIFLDEIGDMPLELQAKLLRVLQEREIQRLGSSETIKVDVRVIAATNANLLEKVRQRAFREDLYYRLNVIPLRMPPLRQHAEDIPELVNHFTEKICRAENVPLKSVSCEAMDRLKTSPWPGNIRQLENSVEMAVALGGDRSVLSSADFGLLNRAPGKLIPFDSAAPERAAEEIGDLDAALTRFERNMIERALEKTSGNKTAAAVLLGLKRTTLIMKLRTFEQAAVLQVV